MDFMRIIDLSASGLAVQRARMDVAASNLANARSTRSEDGGPYRRQDVVLASDAEASGGVHVAEIRQDTAPARKEYDPGHPDADPAGFVAYPNVNTIEEMVDMITASRAYEAGLTTINTVVAMAERAIGIGR